MILPIIYLSMKTGTPESGYWDQYLIDRMLNLNVVRYHKDEIDNCDAGFVVIPGAYQADKIDYINAYLQKFKKCVVIVTSDEENKFPIEKLEHQNMKLYATYAYNSKANVTWLPIGPPPQIRDAYKNFTTKQLDLFYSGQVNHDSRRDMMKALENMPNSQIFSSDGFAKGLSHEEYYKYMIQAKVVPAPRGNISPDSFRLYEAIECGAVPIAENPAFFNLVFKDYPFPVVSNPEQWTGYIQDAISQYPVINNECQSWWMRKRFEMREEMLTFLGYSDSRLVRPAIVIPVSPIASNPYTDIFEKTYNSVRHHFPIAPIYVTFDGVREEQEHMRAAYNEHIRRVLWLIRDDARIIPYIFKNHIHQVGMLRSIIQDIKQRTILYVEHDCPLVTNFEIPWEKLQNEILEGNSNLIRFHFEAEIPKEHKDLMIYPVTNDLLPTVQWSQRPHLASTAFYQRILNTYFSSNAKCFIEDRMHGAVIQDFSMYGVQGWQQWRLHIYHPEGQIKRSYTLDGRAGDHKFDDTQIW